MSEPIPLARPSLGDAEVAAAERALRSGRLTLGPETERFERRLADLCGRRFAVAVASGTAALDLVFRALGLAAGDEVLVTAFGFPAAANLLEDRGARLVPVDVSEGDWCLDSAAAGAALSGGARAIVSIDPFGLVAESAPLLRLATEREVPLIADAACALGGRDSAGTPGGGYGLAATLSFHPRKVITTGEGGAVLTDDPALADAVFELRNHGQRGAGRFVRAGTNARLSEIAAAIGSAQLERLEPVLSQRRILAEGYLHRLAPLADAGKIRPQKGPPGSMHAYQTFAVLLAEDLSREQIVSRLGAAGIESGPATYALSPGKGAGSASLPVASALRDRALALPLYPGMRSAELDRVAGALMEAIG